MRHLSFFIRQLTQRVQDDSQGSRRGPTADASLTLFDPATVSERNDYLNPEIRPEGIDCVWIHGALVLDHGALIAPRPFPGRTLASPVRR